MFLNIAGELIACWEEFLNILSEAFLILLPDVIGKLIISFSSLETSYALSITYVFPAKLIFPSSVVMNSDE